MHEAYPRLFEPALIGGAPNPAHLEQARYLALGRAAAARGRARATARRARRSPSRTRDSFAPVRVRVAVRERSSRARPGAARRVGRRAAEAELAPPAADAAFAGGGGYDGPLAYRQGKPMRPDVAQAFDRMERAARADGVALLITSAYRSDAEQAVLLAPPPGPEVGRAARARRCTATAPSSTSARPPPTPGWPPTRGRFHFVQRYAWEPWHYGYALNARSTVAAATATGDGAAARRAARASCRRASRRLLRTRGAALERVGGAARRADLRREQLQPVRGQPRGRAGHRAVHAGHGARRWASTTRSTPAQAIDAQAHLMRDLLRQFASVPLALAAYNAGPGAGRARAAASRRIPETRGYVARILGLLGGAGDTSAGGLAVRLVSDPDRSEVVERPSHAYQERAAQARVVRTQRARLEVWRPTPASGGSMPSSAAGRKPNRG